MPRQKNTLAFVSCAAAGRLNNSPVDLDFGDIGDCRFDRRLSLGPRCQKCPPQKAARIDVDATLIGSHVLPPPTPERLHLDSARRTIFERCRLAGIVIAAATATGV